LQHWWFIVVILMTANAAAADLSTGVVTKNRKLPPLESAWHGEAPHVFLGGQAVLTCGSHGTFSGQEVPPKRKGDQTELNYSAVFIGELTLNPPLVRETRTYPLKEPIRMSERLIRTGAREGTSKYSTELTKLVFGGSGFPRNVIVRESLDRQSAGNAQLIKKSKGQFLYQSSYQVWLEISIDGGRSWHLSRDPVTMSLVPEIKRTATIVTRPPSR
jgi:hypothetical protein